LTLDEVRQSGRLAWHPKHHYLYADGQLLRVVLLAPPGNDSPFAANFNLRLSSLHGNEQHIQSGWRHLEGCDCPVCGPAKSTGKPKANGRSKRDTGTESS
jgi:hypothetical protein